MSFGICSNQCIFLAFVLVCGFVFLINCMFHTFHFMDNIPYLMDNVPCFMDNVSSFMDNVPRFMDNVSTFMDNRALNFILIAGPGQR